jgi:hypothetical protein
MTDTFEPHTILPPAVGQTELGRIVHDMHRNIERLKRGANTGWITPTLDNGWVAYGAGFEGPQYCRINGIVYLQGMVKNGTSATQIFALPVGFRVAGDRRAFAVATDATGVGRVDVYSSGSVAHAVGLTGYVSLSGIHFPAEA